ncbi:MAG TPA: ParB/RepB/Spo0J family partition protein [Firmicutes bacterium]|nr:ParB/RepB/Spo0J family partition protein [Candidatus Fermentithermobacillaceae bacterium]
MSQALTLDKFQPSEVSVTEIALRPGAVVPGGSDTVSRRLLQNLVRGTSEPILARRLGDKLEIVAGDLEFLVAVRRGARSLKVMVADLDDREALLIRLMEGARRGDINPVEEAEIIRTLNREYGMTQQEIAMRCGRVQSTIANKLRLLRLPEEIISALRTGEIGERHARALLKVSDPARQVDIFKRALRTRASAQEVESMCSLAAGPAKETRGRKKHGLGVVKDIRIYQNGLRRVVREMLKAGLSVVYEEENVENSWEFRVLVKAEGESSV